MYISSINSCIISIFYGFIEYFKNEEMHFLILLTLLILRVSGNDDAHLLQKGIYRSIWYGNLKYMNTMSVQKLRNHEPIHVALAVRHEFSGRGVMRDNIGLLRYLVDHIGVDVSKFCPLVDAFHYRDIAAIDFIISRSTDRRVRDCILEKDAYGDNLLHVAVRNKVSGLSRLIVFALRRKMYDKEHTKALLKSLGLLYL